MAVARIADGDQQRPLWAAREADVPGNLPGPTDRAAPRRGDRCYVEDAQPPYELWFDGEAWRYRAVAPTGRTAGAVVS